MADALSRAATAGDGRVVVMIGFMGAGRTTAARHARASRIETVGAVDDGDLCLTIRDDGRGLPATVRPGTQGLRSMRARARALGADLRIVGGRAGAGTVVELRVPR